LTARASSLRSTTSAWLRRQARAGAGRRRRRFGHCGLIKIANIVELSGAGATAGTNFKDGVQLAVKEINAAGGILGRKIETTTPTRRATRAWPRA
jgi:ABC-type branched-subunit amino acid transport system substrate-binding protein